MSEKTEKDCPIRATKNYKLFKRSPDNRPTNVKARKKLVGSMKHYGWLRCFPLVAVRNGDGHLIVKDGQHRLDIAEWLGLAVHWVEEKQDFDVAETASGQKSWSLNDYAQCFAAKGVQSYIDGLEFVTRYSISTGIGFAILAGTTGFTNIEKEFIGGTFKIKDRKWAEDVATIYSGISALAPCLRTSHFIAACMGVCRVDGFDGKRLIHNANRCREKLVAYATREAYLDLLETVYNYGRQKQLIPLKIMAINAMKARNSCEVKRAAKKAG